MHYLTLIYFLAVLAFSDGSSSFAKDVAATVSKPVKVVFLGDSITAGYGIEKEQAFPYLLAQHFAKAGFPIEPVDAGITGSTSASGPGRIKWLLRSKPELLILELGANDALRGQKLSQTKGNLEKTIDLAQRADVPVLLIGMEIPRNYGETYANEFAQIYPDLAKQKGVYFAPFFKEFLDDKSLMQSDGAHPNIKGHQVIARKLQPILLPLIAELRQRRPASKGSLATPRPTSTTTPARKINKQERSD